MFARLQTGSDRGFWTVLALVLLAVLIPTGCLLYFMNQAIGTQRQFAQQQLGEAYQAQLRLVAERIDSFWEQRGRDLDLHGDSGSAATFFEHCVVDGLADAVIVLNRDGGAAYPSLAAPPRPDPNLHAAAWMEARALESANNLAAAAQKYAAIARTDTEPSNSARAGQAAIRCLLASGHKADALKLNEEIFENLRLPYATGLDGRLIAADENLLLLQSTQPDDSRFARRAQTLFGLLQNYAREMPSSQRLFLMDHMRALTQETRWRTFPTYGAERLAERYLSSGQPLTADRAVRLTGIADLWKMASNDGRTIALYRTATITAVNQKLTEPLRSPGNAPPRVALKKQLLPDDARTFGAGARLPEWQIAMQVRESKSAGDVAKGQAASYLWIGILAIATAVVLAAAGGRMIRQQMKVARLKADLVAAVSHELKTPLASMKLLVESLLSNEQLDPARTRQYLEMVARENNRLSRLIDNFLTFSRMERNRYAFRFDRVRPEAVAGTAAESVRDRYPVELKCSGELPAIYADEGAMVTVLLNLLDNAFKYSGDDRKIELLVQTAGERVTFTVKDNGIGIADRDQKKIFRRFYQVDRGLTRQGGGVGLGLSIVDFIVKGHRGMVFVSSRPGAGSEFTVSVPASAAAGAAA